MIWRWIKYFLHIPPVSNLHVPVCDQVSIPDVPSSSSFHHVFWQHLNKYIRSCTTFSKCNLKIFFLLDKQTPSGKNNPRHLDAGAWSLLAEHPMNTLHYFLWLLPSACSFQILHTSAGAVLLDKWGLVPHALKHDEDSLNLKDRLCKNYLDQNYFLSH